MADTKALKAFIPRPVKSWMRERLLGLGWAPVVPAEPVPAEPRDHEQLAVLRVAATEQTSRRQQDSVEFITIFNALHQCKLYVDARALNRLSRLTGTSLLEAAYILKSLDETKNIEGDWCEYGVAHGRTSALLADTMVKHGHGRRLWLYDSFEGLPMPHSKDVLLHDIFGLGSISAYRGTISFPEDFVRAELDSVGLPADRYDVCKGWITAESLAQRSPARISFAYLDMDFYQSTYDVLHHLIDRMPAGGIAILDDYGFFSEGVRTAASEIMNEFPNTFRLENPYGSKFAVMTRI